MAGMEELKENYWKIVCRTRKSGRISQSVKDKEEEYWKQFPEDVVQEALQIHIDRYPSYKECYTRGIMRNLAKAKEEGKPVSRKNNFLDFEQRNYDFDELEKQLINNL